MRRFAFAALLVFIVWSSRTGAQQPSLDTLLARAGNYTVRYMEVMSTLIAEERYVQNLGGGAPRMTDRYGNGVSATGTFSGAPVEQRTRADVLLMRVGPPVEWRTFRDVFERNELPVRDRDSRLAKLFSEPADSARAQAQRIADESARFNISRMGRWLNEPGLALVFLQPSLQPHFRFTLDKRDGDAWIVKFEEQSRPTIFKHNTTLDNPSSGRFWIAPETGEVSRSEHLVKPPDIEASFTTTFKHDEKLGIAVPAEMKESMRENLAAGNRQLTGSAKYSNYRQARVLTEEKIR